MKKLLVALLAVVMVFSIFGCKKNVAELAVNVGPEPDTIDPALNSSVDGATLIIHAFEGLYKLNSEGVPVPGQAEKHEVSADNLTYTFTLRNGIKWSDGKAVTAGDFVYAWQRAIDPATASDYEYMFDVIKGYAEGKLDAVAVDDKTVQVTLNAPCPYFLELTAFPTFMPVRQDIVEANPEGWATEPATYIGNGPYVMTSWVHDSEMIYTKNKNYYNVKELGPETIKFVLMDDDNAILAAYQTGSVLFIDSVPNDEIDTLSTDPEFHKEGQLGTYYVSFNVAKAPFDNEKIREAFSLAIDRNFIVKQIGKAGQIPADAFVSIGMSDADPTKEFRDVGESYYSVAEADYKANCDKARALLAEAGYPNGEGFPAIEYLTNISTGHIAIAEALQDMWKKELGVTVTIGQQEWNTFLNTRKDGNFNIARDGWLADYNDPITFLDMYVTGGGNNNAQWSNADYDALIKTVKTTTDPAERYTAMHKAEDILMGQNIVAPLYYYVDIFMIKSNVKGFYSSPLGYKYFMYSSVE